MFKRFIGAFVLSLGLVLACFGEQCGAGDIKVEGDRIEYTDMTVRIVIEGKWASVIVDGETITFVCPGSDKVKVSGEVLDDAWRMAKWQVDDSVEDGSVECKLKNKCAEEAEHEVELKFLAIGNLAIDIDCDANWDGQIDERDEPLEEENGGLVGYEKYDSLHIKVTHPDIDGSNITVAVSISGGIELCSMQDDGVKVIVESPKSGGSASKELSLDELEEINCVRGIATSGSFCDCEITAKANAPGCEEQVASLKYTVIDVTVMIDGKSKPKGKSTSDDEHKVQPYDAFALHVDDAGQSPFAPRGTNYLLDVSMTLQPEGFPTNVQKKVRLELSGDVEEYLFTKRIEIDAQGVPHVLYAPAERQYDLLGLSTNTFVLHGHVPSRQLRDKELSLVETKTNVADTNTFTVVKLNLVPDYDRNHQIDSEDEKRLCLDKTFYWWTNNDYDSGDTANIYSDTGSDIPGGLEKLRAEIRERNAQRRLDWVHRGAQWGEELEEDELEPQKQNMEDDVVNGRRDLLDFFPLQVDAHDALKLFNGFGKLKLKLDVKGLGIVDTDLRMDKAGDYLFSSHSSRCQQRELHESKVDRTGTVMLDSENKKEFFDDVRKFSDAGILMVEGSSGGNDATIYLIVEDEENGESNIINSTTPISITDVRDFYNVVSLYGKKEEIVHSRNPELDELFSEDKDVFSLHGFKVNFEKAEGWHSEFFKRLYQSQSSARFWGVSWDGAQSDGIKNPGRFYHQDAAYAFVTAINLQHFVATMRAGGKLKGEVSVMAHSLGNMVVSSAIAIRKMRVNRYFMLDAAVPAEAYVGEMDNDLMINPDWREYPKRSFCSKWYQLFSDAADINTDGYLESDARKSLKWPSLFDSLDCTVYNYYSKGDEVFELNNNIWMIDGLKPFEDFDLSQYCWQKQEVGKGSDMLFNIMEDTNPGMGVPGSSGGWGFHRAGFWAWPPRHVIYTPEDARKASKEMLMKCPVFAHTPEYVYEWDAYDNVSTRAYKTALLCHVVPAMSGAAGNTEIRKGKIMNKDIEKLRSGWGRNDKAYRQRWLHCDIKDMAYYYNYKAWDSIVADGNLKEEKQ